MKMKKLIYLLFIISFISCKQIQYVPVETVKTEYKDRILKDSVYLHDSVFIRSQNDTLYIEKYRYLYRDKIVKDSVVITDSIQVPYPVVQTVVEYKRGIFWWLGVVFSVALVLFGSFKVGRLFR